MSFIQKNSNEIKKPTPFENMKRKNLPGLQDGWMHAELEIKFISVETEVNGLVQIKTRIEFYSLFDNSLVKVIDHCPTICEGDILKLPGVICSFKVNLESID
jgi:hypothetical protein